MSTRRKFTSKYKTKVVLESLTERYTMAQLAARHQLHPNQITTWKRQFLNGAEFAFTHGKKTEKQREDEEKDKLLKTIGQLKVEVDFLKDALR